MQVGHSSTPTFPASPEPFALIIGQGSRANAPAAIEEGLRRMGLRPEALDEDAVADARFAGPAFRLHLASISMLVGQASPDALDLADPGHPSTGLLATSLPSDWRDGGTCWLFVPQDQGVAAEPMHEAFKMMVLLIDLFGASHIFWSPARLWSGAPEFRASIAEMLMSGMPPVLHLVAFRQRDMGDGTIVRTRGLSLFGGQELEAGMPFGWTVAETVKRLARLALDIMLNGPVGEPRRLRGLDAGEWVSLSPQYGARAPHSTVLVEFGSEPG